LLEAQDWISFQVGDVKLLSSGNNVGMFSAQKPADMREEESTCSVMGISISFRVFVMDSVIASLNK
jgi:hypothetical protein